MPEQNKKTNKHLLLLSIGSLGMLALIVKGILEGWEFWMIPILGVAIGIMWWMHITELGTGKIRERTYVIVLLFSVFFHGMHEVDHFEMALVQVVVITLLAQTTGHRRYIDIAFFEYIGILVVQIYLAVLGMENMPDHGEMMRLLLQISVVVVVYRLNLHGLAVREEQSKLINQHAKEVSAANRAMEDFLANVSHEFRTPINIIEGLSSIMFREYEDDRLKAIGEAGSRLEDQIIDITDYAEIASSRIVIEDAPYSPLSLVGEVIEEFGKQVYAKNLSFIIDFDPGIPQKLYGDAGKIKKLLRQMLSNAVKFTERGGIYLRVSVQYRQYGINLGLEVSDTGCGMTTEEQERLGQGFFQADKDRDRSTGGIGLGYSIIYGYTHAMEGFVVTNSRENLGTSVSLSIPQKVASKATSVHVPEASQMSIIYYLNPKVYERPRVREFVADYVRNFSEALNIPTQNIATRSELHYVCDNERVTHVLTDWGDYLEDREFFDRISERITVLLIGEEKDVGIRLDNDRIICLPRPLFIRDVVRILNGEELYEPGIDRSTRYAGIRALIVDDAPMNLVVAKGLFEEYGMQCDTVNGGEEAIREYEKEKYDVIFMDHMMPEIDGVTAKARIQQTGKWSRQRTPMVAFTANASGSAKEYLLGEGFHGFLAKPVDPDEFERVMDELFAGSMREGAV